MFLMKAFLKGCLSGKSRKKTLLTQGLNGGRNRIRTYVGRSPTVLQTVAFDRSAILPNKSLPEQLPRHFYLNN